MTSINPGALRNKYSWSVITGKIPTLTYGYIIIGPIRLPTTEFSNVLSIGN